MAAAGGALVSGAQYRSTCPECVVCDPDESDEPAAANGY